MSTPHISVPAAPFPLSGSISRKPAHTEEKRTEQGHSTGPRTPEPGDAMRSSHLSSLPHFMPPRTGPYLGERVLLTIVE